MVPAVTPSPTSPARSVTRRGAASDFAGVMDGLDDIMGDVLGKMGASAGTIATMSGAMGGLGVAVAVGAAAWSYFGAQQKKAAEEAQKTADATREINEALEEGRIDEAAAKIVEGYGDVLKAAEEAGLGVKEATDFITGASDAVPGFAGRLAELNAAAEASRDTLTGQLNPELANAAAAFENVGFKLDDAKAKFADGNLTIAEQDRLLAEVGAALGDHATDVDKAARAQDRMKASGERLRGRPDSPGAARSRARTIGHPAGPAVRQDRRSCDAASECTAHVLGRAIADASYVVVDRHHFLDASGADRRTRSRTARDGVPGHDLGLGLGWLDCVDNRVSPAGPTLDRRRQKVDPSIGVAIVLERLTS